VSNFENNAMRKLDKILDEQIKQGKQIAVNANDIETLKGNKSWVATVAAAVVGGGAVAWIGSAFQKGG